MVPAGFCGTCWVLWYLLGSVVPVGLVLGLQQDLGLLQVAGEPVQDPTSAAAVHSAQTLLQNLQHQGVWN